MSNMGVSGQFYEHLLKPADWVIEGLEGIKDLLIPLTSEIEQLSTPLIWWIIGPKKDKKIYAYGIEEKKETQFWGSCNQPIKYISFSINKEFKSINKIYINVYCKWYSCDTKDSAEMFFKYVNIILQDTNIPVRVGRGGT
jgi:hypothetical protein